MFAGLGILALGQGVYNFLQKEGSRSSAVSKEDALPSAEKNQEAIQAILAKVSLTTKPIEATSTALSIVDALEQVQQESIQNKIEKITKAISVTTKDSNEQTGSGIVAVVGQLYEVASRIYAKGVQGIVNDLFIYTQEKIECFSCCEPITKIDGPKAHNNSSVVLPASEESSYTMFKTLIEKVINPFSRMILGNPVSIHPQNNSPLLLTAVPMISDQPQSLPLDIFAGAEPVCSEAASGYIVDMHSCLATAMSVTGIACVVWEGCRVYKIIKNLWPQKSCKVEQLIPAVSKPLVEENKDVVSEAKALMAPVSMPEAIGSPAVAIDDSPVFIEDKDQALQKAYELYQEAMSQLPQNPEEIKQRAAELHTAWEAYSKSNQSVNDIKDDNASHGG